MKKFMSVLMSVAIVFAAVPVSVTVSPVVEVSADEAEDASETVDVTQYTYKITPILDSFEYYIYVETDNPDPYSFAFADYDSAYADDEENEEDEEYVDEEVETDYDALYTLKESHFVDVEYEDDDTYRVNGGYIFYCRDGASDGGKLTLMQATGGVDYMTIFSLSGSSSVTTYYDYTDTDKTVTAPTMVNYIDYLIDTYTTNDQTFFEKMDAVQAGLDDLAVYPRDVYDSDKPTGYYPALACAWWRDLSLTEHLELMYEEAEGMLLSAAYPFVLDSLGCPTTMSTIAQKLDTSAEISSTDSHDLISVTYDGETREYGGQGSGGDDPLYSEHVGTLFTFDGSSGDFASGKTIDEFCIQLLSYNSVAIADAEYYSDLISGETFINTIAETGGTWLRVASESSSDETKYAYVVPTPIDNYYVVVSDGWVDGRYVSDFEHTETATFDEYPTADIVVSDMTYTDAFGNEHTQDVIFYYDSDTESWIAGWEFIGYWSDDDMPDEFILTADEVASMNVDSKNETIPESGLVYDGTEFPGTEFTNVLATGIEADAEIQVSVGRSIKLDYTITPSNATCTTVTRTSEDIDIAYADKNDEGDLILYAEEIGTTYITLTTVDGGYQTTIKVNVVDHIYSGDYVFDIVGNNSVVLIEYNGSDENVVIPSEVDGYKVVGVDDYAICDCPELESLSLPSGLSTITSYTLVSCDGLSRVWISKNVTCIEENAFCNCEKLMDVYFEGTEAEWNAIAIDEYNDWLTSATIHYNFSSLPDGYTLGDINEDGFIDYLDAMTALRFDAELITLEDEQTLAGDVNGDGSVDSLDAILILRYDAGLITSF